MLNIISCMFGIENNLAYAGELAFANINYEKSQDIRVVSDSGHVGIELPVSELDNRTIIPLRFLFKSIGYNIVWVADSNLILISKNDIEEWRYIGSDIAVLGKNYFVKYINGFNQSKYKAMVNGVDSEEVVDIAKIDTKANLANTIIDTPTETTLPSRSSIKPKLLKIYISPSKQPYNSYIVGNTNEQAEMEDLASRVTVMLNNEYECEAMLATLSLSRHVDGRPLEAKNKECDVYIGLHSNASGTGTSSGAIGFYNPENPTGITLATNIVNELNSIDPVKTNRPLQLVDGISIYDGEGLAEVKHPSNYGMIAVLIETEFHDNPVTANWILTHKYAIAQAYVNGIANTFNLSKK